jgi:hypothetical protein
MSTRLTQLRREQGSILIMTAVTLTAMLGVAALSIDAAYIYDQRNRMGAAADAAALAAAQEYKRAGTAANLQTYANYQVSMHVAGIGVSLVSDPSTNSVSTCPAPTSTSQLRVCVNSPPVNGPFAGVNKYVEVLVARKVPTFFMSTAGWGSMTVSTRAVAGPGDVSGCIFALNTDDPDWDPELSFEGSSPTLIDVPKCGIYSNGDFNVDAGNTVNAKEINIHAASGTISGSVSPAPRYSFPVVSDPLGDMDQVATFNTVANGWNGSSWTCGWTGEKIDVNTSTGAQSAPVPLVGTSYFKNGLPGFEDTTAIYNLNPGVYCGNASFSGIENTLSNDTVTGPGHPWYYVHFNPGVYIINGGGLDWKHCFVNGTGVTFYLTGTNPTFPYPACTKKVFESDPPLNLQLSAPTSGVYEGLLMIQDRTQGICQPSQNPVIANFKPIDMTINGTIYFPNHHIAYGATTSSAGKYTILIGGTILIQGKATFSSDFVGAGLSGSPIKRATSAE